MAAAFDPMEPPGGRAPTRTVPPGPAQRASQRLYELSAAAIRAQSGERDLHFRAGRLFRGERALPLFGPHLMPEPGLDDIHSFRGAADGAALRLQHSDPLLHTRLCPRDPIERWVFELLEQSRVESLVPESMPGAARNLRHRFEAWSMQFYGAGGADGVRGLLLFTVMLMARSRVSGVPAPEAAEDLIETTRGAVATAIGTALGGLRRERLDQAAYAQHALVIARFVAKELGDGPNATQAEDDLDPEDATSRRTPRFGLQIDFDAQPDDGISRIDAEAGRSWNHRLGDYRVFTRAFDRECRAAQLVRPALLPELRETLDARVAQRGFNLARLARVYQSLLALPEREGWDDGQEEGLIDGRRLAQLVASPAERRLFRVEAERACADATVSVLIDCSGSMREHAESVAVLVDVLSRVVDMAGAQSEVLGFTTGAWNGGRAVRAWQRAGSPPQPGRLNEQLHAIFKDAATPWRRARPSLAALLKPELYREGIDGEAVQWACERLMSQDTRRRILLVLTDGCPNDTATNLANDERYLDRHLRAVVAAQERAGDVQVIGVGVGLDLSPYYRRSLALDLRGGAGMRTLLDLAEAIRA